MYLYIPISIYTYIYIYPSTTYISVALSLPPFSLSPSPCVYLVWPKQQMQQIGASGASSSTVL